MTGTHATTTSPAVAITGATSGIGRATAELLAARGARLALLARRAGPLEHVGDELRRSGTDVVTLPGDVGAPHTLERFATAAADRFGTVDALYLNAGTAPFGAVETLTPGSVDACLAVNVRGALLGVKAFLPFLTSGSTILLTGSALHRRPLPEAALWAASTSAIVGMAAALAVELAPRGVRVNVISHGPVDTPAYDGYGMPAEAVTATKAAMASGTLLRRMGRVEEIAELAALLLVGTGGRFVTGTEIVADGGWAWAAHPGGES